MKDLTLCVVCVILGILLSMLFKQACGCKNVVEGLGEPCVSNEEGIPLPDPNLCATGEVCRPHGGTYSCLKPLPSVSPIAINQIQSDN